MTKGYYIVIEGAEGVGKTTQVQRLSDRLQAAKIITRTMREPDSQSELTARAIRAMTQDPRYPMNTRTEVLLYNAARSQSLGVIKRAVDNGVACVVDRNYLTTLAIQYYGRGDVPDYDTINRIVQFAVGDMEPDLTLVLDADEEVLKERVKDRYGGERFDNLDVEFLKRVRQGYLDEAAKRAYPVIDAGQSPDAVAREVWQHAERLIKTRGRYSTKVAAAVAAATPIKEVIGQKQNPLLSKTDQGHFVITDAGREFLNGAITNVDGNVYAIRSEVLPPPTAAAAMARLSRRADDMRITILDEFAGREAKDEQLLHRVITAYGDDSVQQLASLYMVVEGASNLLTKKLEWGRLSAYLEQSTRYIYFDQKDANGRYRYYTPSVFNKNARRVYNETMDMIFGLYSEVVNKLTEHIRRSSSVPKKDRDAAWKSATKAQACDAARPLLPVATKSTVGIVGSAQSVESLIMRLLSDPIGESRITGEHLLEEARKVMPVFFERADKPERGGAWTAYRANTYAAMRDLAESRLPGGVSPAPSDAVDLLDYWPKNELDLLPHMLYEHSDLPLEAIAQEVSQWPYDDKIQAFRTYMGERLNRRHRPGRALEVAHYSFDLMCDYGIFRDLQRHRMVDDLEWQELTPRYGFDVPRLVEAAGLSETYETCFDLSFKLHSALRQAGYHPEAQYATLLGHRMRWKVTYNARQAFHLHELRTTPQGHPGYRKLVRRMHEKLAGVHPLLAESMIFVNKDEDPELTRLAAERYTQYKLAVLDKPGIKS